MNQSNRTPDATPDVRTLWQRLRPFIRRDLQGRLISAAIAALVIAGLGWFGISAFTRLDTQDAQNLRVELGIEGEGEVCHPRSTLPDCTYDDRTQTRVDKEWARDKRIRAAILHDLQLRIDDVQSRLDDAKGMLERQQFDFSNGEVAGGDEELAALLALPDLSPLRYDPFWYEDNVFHSLHDAATWDHMGTVRVDEVQTILEAAIADAQAQLQDRERTVERQLSREIDPEPATAVIDREAITLKLDLDVDATQYDLSSEARHWITQGRAEDLSRAAFNLADAYPAEFATALLPNAAIWEGGWDSPSWSERDVPSVRYESPIEDATRYELAGTLFLAIACFVFVVVGPIVTATATAREREAGTLPVLRMTGLSAGDLAMAMILGPNVFAAVLGGTLLLAGTILLAITGHLGALLLPLAMLAVLATATHLTAIGLGDALGQRVNAMVVGALLGVGIVIPGLLGSVLAGFDFAATGLLLGPLPPLWANIAEFTGINTVGFEYDELAMTMLAYSVAVQAVLGLVCLGSWRRRVEQGWAPLFRPLEGVILALASIGCSALTLLDISNHHQAEDFDALNLLTFLSTAFLVPMLAWLLVASLRRPARARAVADHIEARRAFLRFQGFVVISATLVGMTYSLVMGEAGLASEDSELMWATLTQLLLVAETGVATLLWASRRRDRKARSFFIGGAVILTQLIAVVGTYGLEVEHVALNNAPAMPMLMNAEVSGYWTAFLVLCWSAGLALIFTALMRRRDQEQQEAAATDDDDEYDDDEMGMPGRRLIH